MVHKAIKLILRQNQYLGENKEQNGFAMPLCSRRCRDTNLLDCNYCDCLYIRSNDSCVATVPHCEDQWIRFAISFPPQGSRTINFCRDSISFPAVPLSRSVGFSYSQNFFICAQVKWFYTSLRFSGSRNGWRLHSHSGYFATLVDISLYPNLCLSLFITVSRAAPPHSITICSFRTLRWYCSPP